MAFRTGLAGTLLAADGFNKAATAAFQVKRLAQDIRARASAGSATSRDIIDRLLTGLVAYKAELMSLTSVPGIAAYARQQVDDDQYNVGAEFTAMIAAITATIDWIVANYPTSADGWVERVKINADGTLTSRTFTAAQLSALVSELDTLIAAID